jgi:hypothetical protein
LATECIDQIRPEQSQTFWRLTVAQHSIDPSEPSNCQRTNSFGEHSQCAQIDCRRSNSNPSIIRQILVLRSTVTRRSSPAMTNWKKRSKWNRSWRLQCRR